MNSIGYLKQVKRRLGIESDYALAQRLGLTRSAISHIQNGKNSLGDETAVKVAEILDLPKGVVVADAHAEREKNPVLQAVWRGIAEQLSLGIATGFEVLSLLANRAKGPTLAR